VNPISADDHVKPGRICVGERQRDALSVVTSAETALPVHDRPGWEPAVQRVDQAGPMQDVVRSPKAAAAISAERLTEQAMTVLPPAQLPTGLQLDAVLSQPAVETEPLEQPGGVWRHLNPGADLVQTRCLLVDRDI
jgi:hypothetical protein